MPTPPERAAQSSGETRSEEIKPLEQFRLGIGDALQLQTSSGQAPQRYYVKLIGYLKDKGLIVTTPTQDGKYLLMREGQGFVVRMFSGKSVYAFPSSIIKSTNVPYPHLHLSYPQEVRGLIVRGGVRAPVRLIASVQDSAGITHPSVLGNLSIGGCSLHARKPLGPIGANLRVKFRLTTCDTEHLLNIEGTVRNLRDEPADEDPALCNLHGIKFETVSPDHRLVLTAFVYKQAYDSTL